MLIDLNKRYLDYTSVSKSIYIILLIIIIGFAGWYLVPRVVDKAYHGGFDQKKIESVRGMINGGASDIAQDELLAEVEMNNPKIDDLTMYQETREILQEGQKSFSSVQKQTILNNLNKK